MKTKHDTGISPAALSALAVGDIENFLVAATPGGIEAQEKRGQLEQAERETLPIEGTLKDRMGRSCDSKKTFEALGFKFGKVVEGIFVEATFPAGWEKRPTDHSMWSDLVDNKGRKRGAIFYKAAFYDRSAHVHLSPRFGVGQDYDSPTVTVSIRDACGKIAWEISGLAKPDYSKDRENASANYDKIEAARAELWKRLKAEYPDCDSPSAYWDAQ